MSVMSALYQLLIGPLELFFEILFAVANRVLHNPGMSIIFLSLAMNFLVLPLYRMADALQEEERVTEERLRPWVTHIKKTFTGDERFMILQTYYRQNGYKTTDPLKGSVSLLLEIPFFMAAYNFLSDLYLLQGATLGPIENLGAPDGLLVLGGVAVNLLPIVMTVINLISSAIYLKGAPLRSKIQLLVMAVLFLVLLYDSPSGLVFYWTLNNLFSLVKNIFMKIRNPGRVFCAIVSALDAVALVLILVLQPMHSLKGEIVVCAVLALAQIPLIRTVRGKKTAPAEATKQDRSIFLAGGVFLTVLTGIMIPTLIIHASPQEFLRSSIFSTPLHYVFRTFLTAAGFFLVWAGVFYLLASGRGKKTMGFVMAALCAVAVLDFQLLGRNYGNMSANLIYDVVPSASLPDQLINLALVGAAVAAVYLIRKHRPQLLSFVCMLTAVATLATSAYQMTQIDRIAKEKQDQIEQSSAYRASIPLSREGKNVIVLMMDRGISSYVPYLMNEKPELQEQFAGFTYYPNTVSFGGHTNFGSPALFGGYEYTPEEINRRSDETLEQKQNEALTVLPRMFSQEGFRTSVFDPPCAGYDWIPDLSIYDAYPDISACNSMGQFDAGSIEQMQEADRIRTRNFFCYSLFRIIPASFQPYFYDDGAYNALETVSGHRNAPADINAARFVEAFAVLENLENITKIHDGTENTFLMMTNDSTHEPTFLQAPEYLPADDVDNSAYDAAHPDRFTLDGHELRMDENRQIKHYHINMASYLKLGEWFDYLRAEGVYDNTRIIIVSDHGAALHQIDPWQFGPTEEEDLMYYNALLMVKDFGATEFTVDHTFMTNADTPALAIEGVLEDHTNPFTGADMDRNPKQDGPLKIFGSHEYDINANRGNTFHPGPWYTVHDDVHDPSNWEILGVE